MPPKPAEMERILAFNRGHRGGRDAHVSTAVVPSDRPAIRLGLWENLAQFTLLVIVNAFVGAMVGMERSILPAIAEQEFHLAARTAVLSFIVVFGVTKALTNYAAGRFADRVGRKQVLVAGWVVAVPVPFMLMWAPSWNWILVANALLGVSQGFTWSTTVIMKIDLVGQSVVGWRWALTNSPDMWPSPAPPCSRVGSPPDTDYAGSVLSRRRIRRRRSRPVGAARSRDVRARRARIETSSCVGTRGKPTRGFLANDVDRSQSLDHQPGRSCEQPERRHGVGPVSPVFRDGQPEVGPIGVLAAIYPATWGIAQLATGALSDRVGRKWLIATGMWVQAVGISVVIVSRAFLGFAAGGVCSASAPRWYIRRFWPPLVMSRSRVARIVGRCLSPLAGSRLRARRIIGGCDRRRPGLAGAMWVIAAITGRRVSRAAVRLRATTCSTRD